MMLNNKVALCIGVGLLLSICGCSKRFVFTFASTYPKEVDFDPLVFEDVHTPGPIIFDRRSPKGAGPYYIKLPSHIDIRWSIDGERFQQTVSLETDKKFYNIVFVVTADNRVEVLFLKEQSVFADQLPE